MFHGFLAPSPLQADALRKAMHTGRETEKAAAEAAQEAERKWWVEEVIDGDHTLYYIYTIYIIYCIYILYYIYTHYIYIYTYYIYIYTYYVDMHTM